MNYLVIAALAVSAAFTSCNKDDKKFTVTFTVTFNSNDGSAVIPQTVKEGEKATKPDDPILNGHTFVAWYKEVSFVNEWEFDDDVVTSDITLHAKWFAIDPLFKISGLTIDNYPSVDGSTSTAPLNILIACKLLDIPHEWGQNGYAYAWEIKPYLKDNSEKFWERVKSSQTHESFINLIDHKADLTLSARTISLDEKKYADDAGVSIVETPVALDAFIFIVHPNNPIKSLTIEQIQDIYTGQITNWKEVGGNDATIKPYVRDANSGSQELMESMIMKDIDISKFPVSWDFIFTMAGVFDAVLADVNSICYSLYYYKEHILRTSLTKTISIEEVYPNIETIANSSYPLVSEVYAIIRSDLEKSSMAYKLYELLQTEEAKRVIGESGYLPY